MHFATAHFFISLLCFFSHSALALRTGYFNLTFSLRNTENGFTKLTSVILMSFPLAKATTPIVELIPDTVFEFLISDKLAAAFIYFFRKASHV